MGTRSTGVAATTAAKTAATSTTKETTYAVDVKLREWLVVSFSQRPF